MNLLPDINQKILRKKPGERFYIGFNFSDILSPGETITSAKATAILISNEEDVTNSFIDSSTVEIVDNTEVKFAILNGLSGKWYRVSLEVATNLNNIYIVTRTIIVE